MRNIFFGFLIAYISIIDFLPTIEIPVYPVGFICITFFICIIGYNIVRHQMLNIKLVIRRFVMILLIYIGLLILVLPIAILVLSQILNLPHQKLLPSLLIWTLFLGGIFSIGPLIYAALLKRSYWLHGHLSTGLTHELKSPLNLIQSSVELIQSQLEKPELNRQKTKDYVEIIDRNASRLESFVKDLLYVAKIQEDQIHIDKSEFNLSDLIMNLRNELNPLAEKSGLTILLSIEPQVIVDADLGKITQVISNLLSNAIKFSSQGSISIVLTKKNSEVHFSIQDQGKGISDKVLSKVFDRFYQVDQTMRGTGIGLTIAKAWIEAHGGKIWAESDGEGKGSTFKFVLPS